MIGCGALQSWRIGQAPEQSRLKAHLLWPDHNMAIGRRRSRAAFVGGAFQQSYACHSSLAGDWWLHQSSM